MRRLRKKKDNIIISLFARISKCQNIFEKFYVVIPRVSIPAHLS